MSKMTDEEKNELVSRLINLRYRRSPTRSNTTGEPPINLFIRQREGRRGVVTTPIHEVLRQERRIKKEIAAGESVNTTRDTIATHAWDRMYHESAREYEAFVIYRDMGADRTQKETSQIANLHSKTISDYNRTNQWAARVRAYDEWVEKKERKITERARKEMVERQARLGARMTTIAEASLDSSSGAVQIRPETVADVVRLAEAGTKIERLARGESTENTANVTKLVLAHPLPPWAPDAAKQLVVENVYEEVDGNGNDISDGPADTGGTKA